MYGSLRGEKIRRALDLTSWEAASELIREWEATGEIGVVKPETPTWLVIAVIITGFAAVTGLKARGTRPVAHTRLMGMARLVLVAMAIVLAYFAFRAYSVR